MSSFNFDHLTEHRAAIQSELAEAELKVAGLKEALAEALWREYNPFCYSPGTCRAIGRCPKNPVCNE